MGRGSASRERLFTTPRATSVIGEIFAELEGRRFSGYGELIAALAALLQKRGRAVPAHYRPGDAVQWARVHGWLRAQRGVIEIERPA